MSRYRLIRSLLTAWQYVNRLTVRFCLPYNDRSLSVVAAMPIPPSWNAADALAGCSVIPWSGEVTRFHAQRYPATDPGGSLRYPGRYHRNWPTLYTCLRPEASIGEFLRHSTPSALS